MTEINNENRDICGKCGGSCCKSLPGMMFPEDVLALYARAHGVKAPSMQAALVEALTLQNFVVDYWEGQVSPGGSATAYFIRPRAKNDDGAVVSASWGGECCFLMPTGCSKPFDHRPRVCRELVPRPGNRSCASGVGKFEAAVAWDPYREDVLKAIEKIEGAL